MSKPARIHHTDAKGRLSLGKAHANQTFIREEHGNDIVLHLARVIPQSEAWLYETPTARAALRRGLKQARAGKFSAGPDLSEAAMLAKTLNDG